MTVEYRKLCLSDLNIFIQIRIQQLQEEGTEETYDLTPYLESYYMKHILDHTFVAWLAIADEKLIGTSAMSFVEKPPYYGCPSGKIGLLSSMFTNKAYRRMGIARTLLNKVVQEAKDYGCGAIQITASNMGTLLYTDFGFKKNENFMYYTL